MSVFPLRHGWLVAPLLVFWPVTKARADVNDQLPPRASIIADCIRANDYWIANNGGETNPAEANANRWDAAAYYTGNQLLTEVLRDDVPGEAAKKTVYLNRAVLWSEKFDWERGPEGLTHADAHCSGQIYIDLYRLDPRSVRLQGVDGTTGIKPTMDYTVDTSGTDNDWSWIDAFYMAGPTLAKLDATVGEAEGRDYSAKGLAMYLHMRDSRNLFDDDWGLWYRDNQSKNTTTENGMPEFWGRGNGWVIGGLVRVLDELGPDHEDYEVYAGMLRTMSAALVPLQQQDGFWRASLADPDDSRWNNPETSATAFITYAMTWGIRHGILDEATYRPIVAMAWNGMADEALDANGRVGWVQNVGRAPAATTANTTKDFGVGAFLLAGAEVSLLAEDLALIAYAGSDQRVSDDDYDGYVEIALDASGTVDRDDVTVLFEWLHGGQVVAEGMTATVRFPIGEHAVTLRVSTNDGQVLTDDLTVEVIWPPPAITASAFQTGNTPSNTMDGSLSTRWSAEGNQWIAYDLHMTTLLKAVSIAFLDGDARTAALAIEVSTDGDDWTEVFYGQSGGTTQGLERFDFDDVFARHVRIRGFGNSQNDWNSYLEVELDWEETLHDGNRNGLPDAWEQTRIGVTLASTALDHDGDGLDASEEWLWGNDPRTANHSPLLSTVAADGGERVLMLRTRTAEGFGYAGLTRRYTIETSVTMEPDDWQPLPGYTAVEGNGAVVEIPLDLEPNPYFYRATVSLE